MAKRGRPSKKVLAKRKKAKKKAMKILFFLILAAIGVIILDINVIGDLIKANG